MQSEFVPSLAVFFALISALAGVSILIFFIHHIASSIQASNILASIAKDTLEVISEIYPRSIGDEVDENISSNGQQWMSQTQSSLLADSNGYIQSVNLKKLKCLAVDQNIVLRIEYKVGEFVVKSTPLVSIYGVEETTSTLSNAIHSAFILSTHRSLEQDISFGIRQLVDIALKALSPGINDTTTAVMTLNYLTTIMVQLASKPFSSSYHYEEKNLRLITQDHSFKSLLNESFDQIRESTKGSMTITLTLISSLRLIIGQTKDPIRLRALDQQMVRLEEMVRLTIKSDYDCKQINKEISHAYSDLKSQFASCSNFEREEADYF